VASDLPSLREMLRHKKNAYFVQPDNPKMLADGILHVMQDRTLSERMTETAYAEVQEYTWDKRAAKIVGFFKQHGTRK
jgi:glycosyltransferase involved in cell wall biosynthesis